MNLPTVLIVDDDTTTLAILARLLQPEFEVVFATSAAQALEMIPNVLPDLILLDVVMPDMDGYTLCVQLKADAATAAIPIIFVTGLQDSNAESHGLEIGAADYVTKPFIPNVVRAPREEQRRTQARPRSSLGVGRDGRNDGLIQSPRPRCCARTRVQAFGARPCAVGPRDARRRLLPKRSTIATVISPAMIACVKSPANLKVRCNGPPMWPRDSAAKSSSASCRTVRSTLPLPSRNASKPASRGWRSPTAPLRSAPS